MRLSWSAKDSEKFLQAGLDVLRAPVEAILHRRHAVLDCSLAVAQIADAVFDSAKAAIHSSETTMVEDQRGDWRQRRNLRR